MPSTVIRSFSYADERKELRVVFQTGRVYLYQGVPRETYEAMRASFSKGIFFNNHIRDHFRFLREPADVRD